MSVPPPVGTVGNVRSVSRLVSSVTSVVAFATYRKSEQVSADAPVVMMMMQITVMKL